MITLALIQKRLIESIKLSGMSQKEIAEQLNLSISAISHIYNGDNLPALDTFAKLCKLLDFDIDYVLCQDKTVNDN